MYQAVDDEAELGPLLGVTSLDEARKRGCILGFDNRFGGELLACQVVSVLTSNGFTVHYAGESTTGVLSVAVLEYNAAFSINLTPSHNPLEYGGYKFNAADAGPAPSEITERITTNEQNSSTRRFPLPQFHVVPRGILKLLVMYGAFIHSTAGKILLEKTTRRTG